MSKIKIDTYYNITCDNCFRSWSTDFNLNTGSMNESGMGMATNKANLSRMAYSSGWKCIRGRTLCPHCVKNQKGT